MDIDSDIAKVQEERKKKEEQLAALGSVSFDKDLYGGGGNRFEGYEVSIPVNEEDDEQDPAERDVARKLASYTAPKSILNDLPRGEVTDEDLGFKKPGKIIDREDDYRKRWRNRIISPERNDAFAMGDKTPDASVMTYADVMRNQALERDKEETLRLIAKKKARGGRTEGC